MKASFTISLTFLLLIWHVQTGKVHAQDVQFNAKGSQVWIKKKDGKETPRGLLWRVTEDSVIVAETELKSIKAPVQGLKLTGIHYSEIERIKIQPMKAGQKGMLLGALVGLGVGVGVGFGTTENPDPITTTRRSPDICLLIFCIPGEDYQYTEDPPRNAGAVIAKILIGVGVGALVGGVIADSSFKKFQIQGSESEFQKSFSELDKKAFWTRQPKITSYQSPKPQAK
mgnify:CR=1 FL=1